MKTMICILSLFVSFLSACGEGYPPTGIYRQSVLKVNGNCDAPLHDVSQESALIIENHGAYGIPITSSLAPGGIARYTLVPERDWRSPGDIEILVARDDMPRCRHAGRRIGLQILNFLDDGFELLYREDWTIIGECREGRFLLPSTSCYREQTISFKLEKVCATEEIVEGRCTDFMTTISKRSD